MMLLQLMQIDPKSIDLEMRQPQSTSEASRCAVKMFFLLRNIRYKMVHFSKLPQEEIDDIFYVVKRNKKKNVSDDWKPGETCTMDQRRIFPCRLLPDKRPCFVAED